MPKVEEALAALVTKTSSLHAGPWSMKLFYLCFFGYVGITTAYLGLYLGAIGLNGTQIGVIASSSFIGWRSDAARVGIHQ